METAIDAASPVAVGENSGRGRPLMKSDYMQRSEVMLIADADLDKNHGSFPTDSDGHAIPEISQEVLAVI